MGNGGYVVFMRQPLSGEAYFVRDRIVIADRDLLAVRPVILGGPFRSPWPAYPSWTPGDAGSWDSSPDAAAAAL